MVFLLQFPFIHSMTGRVRQILIMKTVLRSGVCSPVQLLPLTPPQAVLPTITPPICRAVIQALVHQVLECLSLHKLRPQAGHGARVAAAGWVAVHVEHVTELHLHNGNFTFSHKTFSLFTKGRSSAD